MSQPDDYLFDPDNSAPDPEVQRLEALLRPLRHGAPLPSLPPRAPALTRRRWWPAALAAAALLLATLGALWLWPRAQAWPLTLTQGQQVTQSQLKEGQWLHTGSGQRARLQVADIGYMDVAPQTRLQLQATGQQHRLHLAQGRIQASVIAPPRLLVVQTPLADAVDLGCAYSLEVQPDGGAWLQVTSGFVALETPALSAFVPQGAHAYTSPGVGVGTPAFDDAPLALQEALRRFDAHPDDKNAVQTALQEARPRDTLSLWHMLQRAPQEERGEIYDRVVELLPASSPPGLQRRHAVELDREMLQRWQDQLWLRW